MARSRRTYRRSTSQRAVSILASALPSPLQRVADTRFGSTLMMLGIPALLVGGYLHLNWEGGFPHLSIDRNRAAEIQQVARDEFGRIGNQGTIQQWERSAIDLWNASQGQQQSPYASGYPTAAPNTGNQYANAGTQYDWQASTQQHPIPSSSAAKNISTQSYPQGNAATNNNPNAAMYYQQQAPQQQPYYQQTQPYQQSQQSLYQQPQQQPYSQSPYPQQSYSQPYSQPAQAQSYQSQNNYQSQNYGQWRQ